MIRINLLSLHEIKTHLDIKREFSIVILSYILVFLSILYLFFNLNAQKRRIKTELNSVQTEIRQYKDVQTKLSALKKEKRLIEQKLKVISILEAERKKVVAVLDVLADNFLINKMWFEELNLKGDDLNIKGIALGNEAIAEFMRKLKKAPYFKSVNLIKTEKKNVQQINLTGFSLNCKIKFTSGGKSNAGKT